MTKVIIYWPEGTEIIEFENYEDAHWFVADALEKCGSVIFEVQEE